MPYIIALAVILVVGLSYAVFKNPNNESEAVDTAIKTEEVVPEETSTPVETVATEPKPEVVTEEKPAPEVVADTSDYTDGSYTTSVTYFTPKKDEYLLDVTLTIKNDIVTGATIEYSQGAEKDPNAQRFEAAYEAVVVGKEIDTLSLSRVGGASLTTRAFNNALTKIKLDAGA